VVLLADTPEARAKLAGMVPSIAAMTGAEGGASAYVCRDYTCQLPVSEPSAFAELIQY